MNSLIADFIASHEDKSRHTLESYKFHLTELLGEFGNLLQVSGVELKEYFREMKETARPATVNAKMSSVRAFYKWLKRNEHISENPTSDVLENIPNPQVNDLKFLTVSEVEYSLQACKNNVRDFAIIRFMLDTAARVGEVVKVTIPEFKRAQKEKKIVLHGKGRNGGQDRFVAFDSPKTIKAIKTYLKTRKDNCPFLFVSKFNKPMHERSIQKLVKKYMYLANARWYRKCEIDKTIMHPHVFRHTAITEFYRNTRDIMATKEFAGHNSINTTVRYVHLVNLGEQGKTQRDLPWNNL